MNRFKLFIENFFAYGFINILNKIVPLLMLPIITRMLPNTADFGRFDLFNMIINFGSAFAVLGLYDAMFREYFEKSDPQYKKNVTSTTQKLVFVSSIIVMVVLILFNPFFSKLFFGDTNSTFVIIMAAFGVFIAANQNIVSAPTRMNNRRTIYIVSGLSNSIIYYLLAIMFVYIGFGYQGLIYSNLVATGALLIFFIGLNHKEFDFKLYDKKVAKTLLSIGLPLLPVFIIYWAFNSTDKIMIANMLDVAQVGIYSIGARVASISQFIYTAFAGGWQFFAFSTMKDDDQVEMTSKIFEYLGVLSFIAFIVILPFNQWIFNLLFTADYTKGAEVFPYLFLSPLLLMLVQTAGNQFLVVKKSYYMTIALAIGVIVNVVLNYFLIQSYGIIGCALSTLTGYAVSVLMVVIVTTKMKLLKLSKGFILIAVFMVVIVLCMFFKIQNVAIIFMVLCIITMILNYRRDVVKLINGLKSLKK